MEKILKKERGITLIALIITIVVLIILATVVINLSLGQNGLFNKAKYASQSYKNAQNYEDEQIAIVTNTLDQYAALTRAGGSNINYSTSEQDTGLKWINGETIYQKTFTYTNISSGDNEYLTGLTNASIKNITGTAKLSDGWVIPLPATHGSNNSYSVGVFFQESTGKLNIEPGSLRTLASATITLQYTKTAN